MIAKIEKPEAIKNLDAIIKISNGIMIARGDLGVEFPIEKLPTIQKLIITKCIQRARPVIVATQLMDSMINNPSPTRAEVTDVANAVLDGTDAVMLSAETSVGKHPVKVVTAMNKIIFEAERHYAILTKRPRPSDKSSTFCRMLSVLMLLKRQKISKPRQSLVSQFPVTLPLKRLPTEPIARFIFLPVQRTCWEL